MASSVGPHLQVTLALGAVAVFRLGVTVGLEGPGGRASCGGWAGTGDFFFTGGSGSSGSGSSCSARLLMSFSSSVECHNLSPLDDIIDARLGEEFPPGIRHFDLRVFLACITVIHCTMM